MAFLIMKIIPNVSLAVNSDVPASLIIAQRPQISHIAAILLL